MMVATRDCLGNKHYECVGCTCSCHEKKFSLPLIDGDLKHQLLRIVAMIAPHEAVGLLWGDRLVTLKNASPSPEDSFAVEISEIRGVVHALEIPYDRLDELIIWHSHPAGGVGPSRFDMRNKTPLKHHLVVSLVEGDLVATWY